MAISKEQESRIIIYSLLFLIVGIGGFLFYLGWKDTRFSVVGDGSEAGQEIANKYSDVVVDPSAVTSSPKFKELEPVVVPADFGQEPQPGGETSTTTPGDYQSEFTQEKLGKIPRRNSNPFKPFDL